MWRTPTMQEHHPVPGLYFPLHVAQLIILHHSKEAKSPRSKKTGQRKLRKQSKFANVRVVVTPNERTRAKKSQEQKSY